MHSKDKGDIVEQFVIAHCLKKGWNISKPIGDNQRYDMIIDKGDGKLYKVQTKKGTIDKHGIIYIYAKSSGYRFDGEGKRILFNESYSPEEVDFIASYCFETNQCYLIKNEGKKTISLRIDEPKNHQTRLIKYAKDYII